MCLRGVFILIIKVGVFILAYVGLGMKTVLKGTSGRMGGLPLGRLAWPTGQVAPWVRPAFPQKWWIMSPNVGCKVGMVVARVLLSEPLDLPCVSSLATAWSALDH